MLVAMIQGRVLLRGIASAVARGAKSSVVPQLLEATTGVWTCAQAVRQSPR